MPVPRQTPLDLEWRPVTQQTQCNTLLTLHSSLFVRKNYHRRRWSQPLFKTVAMHSEKLMYYALYPASQKCPQCCLRNSSNLRQINNSPLSSFQERLSSASSFHAVIKTSFIPCRNFRSPYLDTATGAARAVLPSSTGACGVFVSTQARQQQPQNCYMILPTCVAFYCLPEKGDSCCRSSAAQYS